MKHINTILICILAFVFSLNTSAQINEAEKFFDIVSGANQTDIIQSRFQPSLSLVENCFVNIQSIGNQSFRVTISPKQGSNGYTGKAKAIIQYTDGLPPKPRYISYQLNYVASKISTVPDFVTFNNTNEITATPLSNDNTTDANLQLVGIGMVQGGKARKTGNNVFFTPDSDAESGYVLYSATDDAKSTANGMIYFVKESNNVIKDDNQNFSILNTQSKLIFLASSNFAPSSLPTKGSLQKLHNLVYSYQPNKGSSGTDNFTFVDGSSNILRVSAKILSKVQNTSSVRDDKFYTPKNTTATFDVFANDLSSNFPISSFSSELTKVSGGKFTYTPPVGFSGVKNFTYTVNYGSFQSIGRISLFIGNYAPQQSVDYNLNTLKNKALVVTYDVPIGGYSFKILNKPLYGSAEIFDDATTINQDCNDILSKSTLIYTPDNNYYGADSFDIEYCVPNNPCVVYKLYIKVYDGVVDFCPCEGPDCVWSGDMNGDGKVSITDVLALGRYLGLSGQSRDNKGLPFRSGQHAENWKYEQPNGLNIKHLDADGDGILSTADTSAISSNYGVVDRFVPDEVLAIKDYPFELIPNTTSLDSGDLLVLDVMIGSTSKPVIDLAGLAFGLNFSPSIIKTETLGAYFYEDSWFTKGAPSLQMVKKPVNGTIHAALIKPSAVVTDEAEGFKPTGSSGNGVIGKIYAVVTDEAEGFKPAIKDPNTTVEKVIVPEILQQNIIETRATSNGYRLERISTEGIEIVDIDGEKFRLPNTYIDVRINKNNTIAVPTEDKLIVYPNPAKNVINLHFNGKNIVKGYKMYNIMGSMFGSASDINQQSLSINTSAFPEGIYTLQVVTAQGVISKKIKIGVQ